jgi:hypothetical protein
VTHVETLAKRKNVRCTNEECSWHGERKTATALDGPCPKCSSAVQLAAPDPAPPSELQAIAEAPTVIAPPAAAARKGPYIGPPPKVVLGEVRVGHAARQLLAANSENGRRSLADVAGELLDRMAAEANGR